MEEKNNKGFIITIIILIVIILGLGGFIAYDKFLKKEDEEEKIVEVEDAELNLNTFYQVGDILNQFDKAFSDTSSTFFGYPYRAKKLTAKNFDISAALYLSSYSLLTKNGVHTLLKESKVEDNFVKIFGDNLKYTGGEVVAGDNYHILYDGSAKLYGAALQPEVRNKLISYNAVTTKTSVTENEIIVTRKVYYLEYESADNGVTATKAYIYPDNAKQQLVTTMSLTDGKLNEKELLGKYGSKLKTFKYTFSRKNEQTYNFYSIEMV